MRRDCLAKYIGKSRFGKTVSDHRISREPQGLLPAACKLGARREQNHVLQYASAKSF